MRRAILPYARWTAALAISLAIGACRKPVAASLGQPFTVHVHQAARVAKADVELFFRRVAADTRCPQGAQCISAGDVLATFEGRVMKGYPESFDLRLPGGTATTDSIVWTTWQGYRIRLLSLDPAPVAGTRVDTTAYVAQVLVEQR